jgi:hypothetical protein
MKKRTIAALCAALAVSTSASAADGATNFVVGQVEAILSYCSQVNPADRADYRAFRHTMEKWFGERALEGIEQTQDFRTAYSATRDWLVQQGPQGLQACKNSGLPHVKGDEGKDHDDGGHRDRAGRR